MLKGLGVVFPFLLRYHDRLGDLLWTTRKKYLCFGTWTQNFHLRCCPICNTSGRYRLRFQSLQATCINYHILAWVDNTRWFCLLEWLNDLNDEQNIRHVSQQFQLGQVAPIAGSHWCNVAIIRVLYCRHLSLFTALYERTTHKLPRLCWWWKPFSQWLLV